MKKFIFAIIMTLAFVAGQSQTALTNFSGSADSVTTKYLTCTVSGTAGYLTISPVLTKVANTGSTVAGYALLQGSVDGTNYFNVPTWKQSSNIGLEGSWGIDTFTLANSTTNAYSWVVTTYNASTHPYLYYRVKVVMTTCKVTGGGYYLYRKQY